MKKYLKKKKRKKPTWFIYRPKHIKNSRFDKTACKQYDQKKRRMVIKKKTPKHYSQRILRQNIVKPKQNVLTRNILKQNVLKQNPFNNSLYRINKNMDKNMNKYLHTTRKNVKGNKSNVQKNKITCEVFDNKFLQKRNENKYKEVAYLLKLNYPGN